ncbi:hypothetical protein T10_8876 [Trichinella papuae]|uniref:Uncharacterized protein n=1 Tax=Trichinella papuae TaxID=268474 RepID=A0A0V1MZJ6_9BILA|nr:hypothetical protein T10_8876 [Trichinella papuae]
MPQLLIIRHRYGDRYLHNGALEIGFRSSFDWSFPFRLLNLCIRFPICFPMCALLILLRDMQEQLKEQESY